MTNERYKELLSAVIDKELTGSNISETIENLLNLGFTADELINEFHFDKYDVRPLIKNNNEFRPIQTMLTLSTKHLNYELLKELETHPEDTYNINAYNKCGADGNIYGVIIFFDANDIPPTIPDILKRIMEYAGDKNCSIICFDDDAEINPELPTSENINYQPT